MSERIDVGNLSVDQQLHEMIKTEVLPGTGVESDAFWASFSDLLDSFSARNRAHLQYRDELQEKLDDWHKSNPGESIENDNYLTHLKSIVIWWMKDRISVSTSNVLMTK